MMSNLFGVTNIRTKIFSSYTSDSLEKYVNDFADEHNGNIIEIQFNPDPNYYNCMIIYRACHD